jgi:hypothetical protein
VYCRDLEKLIRHIHGTLKSVVEEPESAVELSRSVA